MDEAGIKFLDKMYKDLYMSDIVQHTKKPSDSKTEAIRKFLERIDKMLEMADTDSKKMHIVNMLAKKYVVKEENIPSTLPDGYTKKGIIEEQEKSLKLWIEYLSSTGANYPVWAKIWAIQGMLKMGIYDPDKGSYSTRDEGTIHPFIKANPAIIAKSIEAIMKLVNKEEITDEEEARLTKTRSFSKLYTFFEKKYKENLFGNSDPNDGVWIKYDQGDRAGAIKLSESVQGTPWCTAGQSTAISQVCGPYGGASYGGDFYVYYTKDKDGKYTIPRIAIRCNGHNVIGEIRGVLDHQNLELELIGILEKKLRSMSFLTEQTVKKNLDIVESLRELSRIAKKTESKEQLTEDEVINLYSKNYGFGWAQDPEVEKITKKRNIKEDAELVKDPMKKIKNMGLFFAPHSVEDKEFMLLAIKENVNNKNFASPKLFEDIDFILRASSINKNILSSVKKEFLLEHPNVCMELLKLNSNTITFIPKEVLIQNQDEVVKTIKKNPPSQSAFREVPEEIIENNPSIIKAYKDRPLELTGRLQCTTEDFQLKHPDIILDVLIKSPSNLSYVSKIFQITYPDIIAFTIAKHFSYFKYEEVELVNKEDIMKRAKKYKQKMDQSYDEPLDVFTLFMPTKIQDAIDYLRQAKIVGQQKRSIKRKMKFEKMIGKITSVIADHIDTGDISTIGYIGTSKIK